MSFFLGIFTHIFIVYCWSGIQLIHLQALRCSGDEGQALGGTYMAFHFQSDLSPCLTNAAASRFLITTIPSFYYASWQHVTLHFSGGEVEIVVLPGPTIKKIKIEHPYKIKFQVFDGVVNLTLQAAAKIICGSLNQLADNGVLISQEPWPSNRLMFFFPVVFLGCGIFEIYLYLYSELFISMERSTKTTSG